MKMCNLQQLCLQELSGIAGGYDCACKTISGKRYWIDVVFNSNDCKNICCYDLSEKLVFNSNKGGSDMVVSYAFKDVMGQCVDREVRLSRLAFKSAKMFYKGNFK